jgi:AcrR family transcriptional regulator
MAAVTKRPGAEARRKQILDAAAEVIGGKCYHWATTKEIAQAAGVSERTLFLYFKNKKELYREAVKQANRELFEALGRAAPPVDDIRTFLKMSERNFLAFLDEHPLKVKLLFQALDSMGDEDLREDIRSTFQSLYELFFAIIEKAKERGEINKDVSTLSAVVSILGFHFIVVYVEFLKLDWFAGKNDIYSVVDVFADFVAKRESPLTGHAKGDPSQELLA